MSKYQRKQFFVEAIKLTGDVVVRNQADDGDDVGHAGDYLVMYRSGPRVVKAEAFEAEFEPERPTAYATNLQQAQFNQGIR